MTPSGGLEPPTNVFISSDMFRTILGPYPLDDLLL